MNKGIRNREGLKAFPILLYEGMEIKMTMEEIVAAYSRHNSIRKTAFELGVSESKVRKTLITRGLLEYKRTAIALDGLKKGKSLESIAEELGCSIKVLNSYIPYTKGEYGNENPSVNALRIRAHRQRMREK